MALRIRSFSVKGFRAYGATEQTLNLPADIAAIWGPNSKGKTSLAEAFEFLLTGRIARRELMASTQDEFADALRNAHLPPDVGVYVAASVTAADGSPHEIRRVLTSDYGKRQDCTSRLEIDGTVAAESDLENLGITLSQPPLQAPVLAQHTLSYIFSVRPQDRATYFKTLLEITDLDLLRSDIAALAEELTLPDDPLLQKFDTCATIPDFKEILDQLGRTPPDLPTFTARITEVARVLLKAADEEAPEGLDDQLAAIERILADRRNKTFPVRGFEREELTGWNSPAVTIWTCLNTYLDERGKIDDETRRLAALFDEALKLPTISEITEPIDCSLCGAKSTLTPERVQLIRRHVEETRDFKTAETAAKSALLQLSSSATSLATAADDSLPRYLKTTTGTRRKMGFTVARIRELLGDRATGFVDPWLAQIRPLVRAAAALRRGGRATAMLVEQQTADMVTLDPRMLQPAYAKLVTLRARFAAAIDSYSAPADELIAALNEVLDAQADSAGWQDFINIAREPAMLRTVLVERAARVAVAKELDSALKQIDRAKEQVLDDKFSDYSGLIEKWWNWLRPDEPTFFSAVQPRKGAKRTIDFKAGLSANPNRSAPKVRDVIAVFSHSQLHCLGLALFLARAEHDRLGFIVLDDPVLASDEDYRVHFNATVLSELLGLPMQVIVLTQDHDTWKELETRYRHLAISTAQLFVETPGDGSVIENTSDALLAKISRAKSLARGGHPDSRKECGLLLRDAGERFCKEMLVNDRRAKGNGTASITDYNCKVLEWLCPRVDPLLGHDPSHPGKLQAFKDTVNHACHDNTPPSTAAMTQACGEINFLQKEYLPR
ncbi:MAG: AAA family ATPase [Candidatus Tectomicrobia bacterium]|uniref:AAA family ATPase n=1 Tax=Tectimicrobiota bacterium TaxID=2528274 RepID=A0A932MPE8_UNCTE|nr:AAA family ATPase [Candidatus Tectomicrobia bacterium]